jgi:ADP-heptose:LPS heptosyltransferase
LSAPKIRKVILSRTDAIGDVVLSLPLASVLKDLLGDRTEVLFLGRTYTRPVIESCSSVNSFLNYDTFVKLTARERIDFFRQTGADAIIHVFPRKDIAVAAARAGIRLRVGTTNRLYHWWTCNRLVGLGRKNSDLHEAQLNLRLLRPLGYQAAPSPEEIGEHFHLTRISPLPPAVDRLLDRTRFRLVVHPKTKGSAREWAPANYSELIRLLPPDKYQLLVTGGEAEAAFLDEWVKTLPGNVVNLAGRLSLDQLISLLGQCDGIVAASTGPLHLAAALGKFALGLYPPIRPMHPGRWAPVGKKASFLVARKNCSSCRNHPASCVCMNEIVPPDAARRILSWTG